MKKKCLLLGWPKYKKKISEEIRSLGWDVTIQNNQINKKNIKKYNCVICYRYKFIISKDIISKLSRPIINLHTSFLPFNKGAHPNFWSFVENTPAGVTIHEVNDKLDSGDIIIQKLIDFKIQQNKKLTFEEAYNNLDKEIIKLLLINLEKILNNKYMKYEQYGKGSFHSKSQLPKILKKWDQNIFKTIKIYNKEIKRSLNQKLEIINKIENTRKKNNVNWMDIIRVGLINSPNKIDKILEKINNDDNTITNLFKKLIN